MMVMAKNWEFISIIYRVMYMPGAKILDFSQEEWLLFTSTMVVHRKIFTAQCGWFEKFHEEVMDGI